MYTTNVSRHSKGSNYKMDTAVITGYIPNSCRWGRHCCGQCGLLCCLYSGILVLARVKLCQQTFKMYCQCKHMLHDLSAALCDLFGCSVCVSCLRAYVHAVCDVLLSEVFHLRQIKLLWLKIKTVIYKNAAKQKRRHYQFYSVWFGTFCLRQHFDLLQFISF